MLFSKQGMRHNGKVRHKMVVHVTPQFRIYFGDASDEMYPKEYLGWQSDLLLKAPIAKVCNLLRLHDLMFLHQKHSIDGLIIEPETLGIAPFSYQGDFLITQMIGVGIGILSADCLPVIAYDKKLHIAAIAHAGWQGALAGVVPAMIASMQKRYTSCAQDLIIFFGPSAQRCCYEVTREFIDYLDAYPFLDAVLVSRGNKLYFDIPHFIELQLKQHLQQLSFQIRREYNDCTICDSRFHSHRRGSHSAQPSGRQMTIIVLK
jgi:YfiH family protein